MPAGADSGAGAVLLILVVIAVAVWYLLAADVTGLGRKARKTPAFIAGVFFLFAALLQACASFAPQTAAARRVARGGCRSMRELSEVPFFPQSE